MVFSSLTFLYFFLPIIVICYFMSPIKYRNIILLVSSLIFYAWGEPIYVSLMIFSSVVDYAHAKIINKYRGKLLSKIALLSSIIINLSILMFFKYTGFFQELSNSIIGTEFEVLNIALPIGISFYTFQTMSYSIDVYRNDAPVQESLLDFATYVTLFPQLVAGPIVRYKSIAYELKSRTHSIDKTYSGLSRFIVGLGKKVVLANNLGLIWQFTANVPVENLSLASAWIGIISFALQIYFDFSGYSDMAIGLGRILGFSFPENFNYPYISMSITEFWRRWHMSLGQWFRDYLYIPLGGNRVCYFRWIINIFIVWGATGFWHGAGVNFIGWGIYFAILLILEKTVFKNLLEAIPKLLRHIITIILILISWVIFEIGSLHGIIGYLNAMFLNFNFVDDRFIYTIVQNIPLLIISVACATPYVNSLIKNSRLINVMFIILFLLSTSFLVDASYNPFIYFRF